MSKSPRIYLSIDIDFWWNKQAAEKTLDTIYGKIPFKADLIAVMNHQQLTNHVDKCRVDKLINIDKHSDICNKNITTFECGSWVAYIKNRQKKEYLWVRCDRGVYNGNCNEDADWDENNDWGKVSTQYSGQKINLDKLCDFKQIVGVGLCLSPSWNEDLFVDNKEKWVEKLFFKMVDKYQIPYFKGKRNEFSAKKTRRPPK